MKIQSARVIVTCPGRNFVTLKIETDQGVYGIGDATLNGRELAVVSYLEDHVIPPISKPRKQRGTSYAVFGLKKKKTNHHIV